MKLETGYCLDGNFVLLSEIGKGGMGIVYKAKQLALDRYVAIKLLPPEVIADNDCVQRFYREARLLASLEHPNIVAAKSFGVLEGRTPYLVMEFVEGTNLRDVIRRGEPSLEAGLRIFIQLCEAVSFVHQKGILHRDVKTSNVIICRDDNGDEVAKLIDFGTGRFTLDNKQKITATGLLVGSPPYMSPELWGGGRVDERADIYSLGCIMYEYFCGKRYAGGNTLSEIIAAHVSLEPAKALEEINCGEQTQSMRTIIGKALNPDPDERYQSADSLAADLRIVQNGDEINSVAALPPQSVKKKAKPVTKSTQQQKVKIRPIAAAVIVLSAIAGTVGWQAWCGDQHRKLQQQLNGEYEELIARATNPNLVFSIESRHAEKLKAKAQEFLGHARRAGPGALPLQQQLVAEVQIARADRMLGLDNEAYEKLHALIPVADRFKPSDVPTASANNDDQMLLLVISKESVRLDLIAVCLKTKKHLDEAEKACLWLIDNPHASASLPEPYRPPYDVEQWGRCTLAMVYDEMGQHDKSVAAWDSLIVYLQKKKHYNAERAENARRWLLAAALDGIQAPQVSAAFWERLRKSTPHFRE